MVYLYTSFLKREQTAKLNPTLNLTRTEVCPQGAGIGESAALIIVISYE